MVLLAVMAVLVLMFAPVATARKNSSTASSTSMSSTAGASASASSSGSATASSSAAAAGKKGGKKGGLPKTGGPEPMAVLAGVMLAGSGVVATAYLRRRKTS